MSKDNRAHGRISVNNPVRWSPDGQTWHFCGVRDVSEKGCALHTLHGAEDLSVGATIYLRFPGPQAGQEPYMTGELRWCRPEPDGDGMLLGIELK